MINNTNTTSSLHLLLPYRVIVVILLLCFSGSTLLLAQIEYRHKDEGIPIEDVVYLKDGSVFKGVIIDENDAFIYMVVLEGSTIDIAQWRVKRVLKNDDYLFFNGGRYHHTKGFFWNLSLGGGGNNNTESEHSSVLVGYRLDKRLSIGLGLGGELTTSIIGGYEVETIFSSVFAFGRYYLTDTRRRLFTYGRLGYGIGPDQASESGRHSGGVQGQVGLGIHFASRKRSRFFLSVGYHAQNTTGEQFFLDIFGNEVLLNYQDYWVRHFVFKVGVEFR